MQTDLFDLHPEETERPLAYGDRVRGPGMQPGGARGEILEGYICEFGVTWLILSAEPRCGWHQNGPGLDYGNLPVTGFIYKATAKRVPEPPETTQQELF